MNAKSLAVGKREGLRRETARAGFSLAELMIAVLIMGLLAVMVTPAVVSRLPDYFLNDTQDHLVAQLRAARMTAMADSAPVRVSFDASGGQFTVWADTNNNHAVDGGESQNFQMAPNERVSVSVSPVHGTFTASGEFISGSSGQPTLLINMEASGATSRRGIRVWPSGRVEPTRMVISAGTVPEP